MLDTAMLPDESGQCRMHRTIVRASIEERPATNVLLARYLDGWADADPAKIADATADDYEFHDPLVGRYSKRTLLQYFELLHSRFAVAGVVRMRDLGFTLRGPMLGPSQGGRRRYWREAPNLGLTGLSEIMVTRRGVAAEAVAYDLNMACETLRGFGCDRSQRHGE